MRCYCSPADDRSRSIKAEITFDPETPLLRDTEIGTPALPRFVVKVAGSSLSARTRGRRRRVDFRRHAVGALCPLLCPLDVVSR